MLVNALRTPNGIQLLFHSMGQGFMLTMQECDGHDLARLIANTLQQQPTYAASTCGNTVGLDTLFHTMPIDPDTEYNWMA